LLQRVDEIREEKTAARARIERTNNTQELSVCGVCGVLQSPSDDNARAVPHTGEFARFSM
jgi:hypothetical protein